MVLYIPLSLQPMGSVASDSYTNQRVISVIFDILLFHYLYNQFLALNSPH